MARWLLRRACAVGFVVLVATAACGGDGDGEPEALSATERAQVVRTQRAIGTYCREVGHFLSRRRGPPTEEELGTASAEVDRLVAIARDKPEARYNRSSSIRQVVGDLAEDLEASNCSRALQARFEQALRSGP
jgi:hypothetical protein